MANSGKNTNTSQWVGGAYLQGSMAAPGQYLTRSAVGSSQLTRAHIRRFFFTLAPAPQCDGKHVVFGRVVEGLDILQRISERRARARGEKGACRSQGPTLMLGSGPRCNCRRRGGERGRHAPVGRVDRGVRRAVTHGVCTAVVLRCRARAVAARAAGPRKGRRLDHRNLGVTGLDA
jgi:hypothetical protein